MARVTQTPAHIERRACPAIKPPVQPLTPLAVILLGVLIAGYVVFFGWLSLSRYWSYEMHALDMGNMGQAAWNTLHGHPFYFTNMRLHYAIEAWNTTTRLSFHVEALFPVISLVYVLYPHPESLLVLQTVALGSGAIAVFLLGREILHNDWPAVLFSATYLSFPTLESLNLYEFHPVALATPLLLFAFLFMLRRQNLPFVLCCLAAMGCKEQIGLIVAMMGLYAALLCRNRKVGLCLAAIGVAWSLTAALVVEHHFRQPGTITYMRSRYGYFGDYGRLGHGIHGAVRTVLHDPGAIGRVLFIWPKLGYLLRILAPLGFLAILAPPILVLGAPSLLLNLFSTDYHMYSGLGDNSAELVSIITVASILGARTLIRFFRRWAPTKTASTLVAVWILGLAVWNQQQHGFTPAGAMYQAPMRGAHQRVQDKFVAKIPAGIPISTQDQLDPHLSNRHYLYLLADTGREDGKLAPANSILLDVSTPTYPLPSYTLYDIAKRWIAKPGWGVASAEDGLLLIKKGARSRGIPHSFYTYASAGSNRGSYRLHFHALGLSALGYSRDRVDVPNNPVPPLSFTFYLRRNSRLPGNIQPVVYAVMNGSLISCSQDPLGLPWFPTSRWKIGASYRVRMNPLTTDWQTPGTARLFLELRSMPAHDHPPCAAIWKKHGKLQAIGTLDISF